MSRLKTSIQSKVQIFQEQAKDEVVYKQHKDFAPPLPHQPPQRRVQ